MNIATIRSLHQKYERYTPAAFFISGFLFDILTLSRIDDVFSLVQQFIYLMILASFIILKALETEGLWQPKGHLARYWIYADEVLHFILGSLLSSYTLFYFVSSSLATSAIFLLIISSLLIANELPQVQKKGLHLKVALFSICLYSYLFIVVALALGFVGLVGFILALMLGMGACYLFYYFLQKRNLQSINSKNEILLPPLYVAIFLVVLYSFKILPPIPISAQHIGVYHNVEKVLDESTVGSESPKFVVEHERPWWKIWHNGDQDFYAYAGDKIYCFARIFAPSGFKDKIIFHWLKKYPTGWQSMDRITTNISGGRDAGFRSFVSKSNFESGLWRIQLETLDGREISRIHFAVTKVDEPAPVPRTFKKEIF